MLPAILTILCLCVCCAIIMLDTPPNVLLGVSITFFCLSYILWAIFNIQEVLPRMAPELLESCYRTVGWASEHGLHHTSLSISDSLLNNNQTVINMPLTDMVQVHEYIANSNQSLNQTVLTALTENSSMNNSPLGNMALPQEPIESVMTMNQNSNLVVLNNVQLNSIHEAMMMRINERLMSDPYLWDSTTISNMSNLSGQLENSVQTENRCTGLILNDKAKITMVAMYTTFLIGLVATIKLITLMSS